MMGRFGTCVGLLVVVSTVSAWAAAPGGARSADAAKLLEMAGVSGGLVVHVGCGDGRLTAGLRRSAAYVVHGLDRDPAAIAAGRRRLADEGACGPVRLSLWRGRALPYPDGLVNVLIVTDPEADLAAEALLRVVAPGGVALASSAAEAVFARLGAAAGARAVTIGGQRWIMVRKAWPADIDEWTHWLHGPDGNPVARDRVVGPPRRMQWFATPLWSRSHEKSPSLTGMVSAGGRLFYICDEAPPGIGGPLPDRWMLTARDAFSGVLLWKRPVADWGWKAWSPSEPMNLRWGNPRFIHRRLVAVGDRVYVTLGYHAAVSALDAATGEVVRVYSGTENACEILVRDGVLISSVAAAPMTAVDRSPPLKVVALDAAAGRMLWEAGPFPSLYDLGERGKANVLKQGRLMIACDAERVYAVTEREVLALGMSDGRLVWRVPRDPPVPEDDVKRFSNLGSLMVHEGRVYVAQPFVARKKLTNSSRMTLACLSAETGRELWRKICADYSYTTSLTAYAARGLIWVHSDPQQQPYELWGLDPASGRVRVRYDLAPILTTRHHHRCYRNKATERYLLMGKEGVEYVDLRTGGLFPNRWVRGMCLYGILPANGLLYVTPQACSCNPMTMLQGYWALAAQGRPAGSSADVGAEPPQLERGRAFSWKGRGAAAEQEDWPMHRHDPLRSGASPTQVGPRIERRWAAQPGGRLTAPTAAAGLVFVADRDAGELIAADAETGAIRWRRLLGGPVDSPPTYDRGRLLLGCADGWVYCLRAADGELVWRFRAAPEERFVMVDGRIESAWPVHGSVMLHGGSAYVVAGRSSYLDGGLRIYRLDPDTGRVLAQRTFHHEERTQLEYFEGATSDLLVSDGRSLHLRHLQMDPETLALSRSGLWGYKAPSDEERKRAYQQPVVLPVVPRPAPYLQGGQTLLDDSFFARLQMHLDGGEACHLLCFNRERAYGFQFATSPGHFAFFTPGGGGYTYLAFRRDAPGPAAQRRLWSEKLPLRACAMALAGDVLFVAGTPDVVDPADPWAAIEGRRGAKLAALDPATGRVLAEYVLAAPPEFDSLIAARGRLYFSDREGRLQCWAPPP